jgi:hypothetical protein
MIKLTHLLKEISQPKYLDLDLNDYHELPQRDGINVTHVAYMLTDLKNICKSIDSSLKPGGILVINDYFSIIEKMLKYLPNYTILEFHMGHFNDKTQNSALVVLKK